MTLTSAQPPQACRHASATWRLTSTICVHRPVCLCRRRTLPPHRRWPHSAMRYVWGCVLRRVCAVRSIRCRIRPGSVVAIRRRILRIFRRTQNNQLNRNKFVFCSVTRKQCLAFDVLDLHHHNQLHVAIDVTNDCTTRLHTNKQTKINLNFTFSNILITVRRTNVQNTIGCDNTKGICSGRLHLRCCLF